MAKQQLRPEKESQDLVQEIEKDAAAAAEILQEEQSKPDTSVYTHKFKKPFKWKSFEISELTFDWDALDGADFCEFESEYLRSTGRVLVSPEFTSEFLAGMAAKACTYRDEDGRPVINTVAIRAMPLRDFRVITRNARGFLMRAE